MRCDRVCGALMALVVLSGCASHAPVWENPHNVPVSGKDMAALSPTAAYQAMLARAARLTVDHGYHYFIITDPLLPAGSATLKPGTGITIRVFFDGQTRYPAPGVWDAVALLMKKPARRQARAEPG